MRLASCITHRSSRPPSAAAELRRSAALCRAYADALESLDPFDEAETERVLREIAEASGAGAGRLIHPTRLAVSGQSSGPGLFALMVVLGQEACVRRLRQAADVLG